MNQPNYIHDYMIQPSVSFCMVWSNAFVDLQCFDWSEQKRVFSSPKHHLFNRAMGLPKHERNGFTPKLPTAFFLRLLPGKEVWPHRTDRTRRSQRWRKQVRQNHRQKPGRWGPFDWSQCSLPVKCVTTRDLEVVMLFVGDEPQMVTICQFAPQKSRGVSAKWGTFFWGLEWTEMVNCSAKKNVYISMSLAYL